MIKFFIMNEMINVIKVCFERKLQKVLVNLVENLTNNPLCHNPSLGLATKAKACKGVG
jgi:hypothetical protein